ncbi:MAG: hypothetical protein ABL921_31520 [Pirellula sp.]
MVQTRDSLQHGGIGPDGFTFVAQDKAIDSLIAHTDTNSAKPVSTNGTFFDINNWGQHFGDQDY